MWRNLMELQVQAIFLWLFLGFWNGRTLETDVMNGDAFAGAHGLEVLNG
jgi:hypothetical protein